MTTTISKPITGKPAHMRILFLALCYAPEEVSGAVLITELAEDLARAGHEVSVVTAAPSYPLGKVIQPYSNKFLQRELMEGVNVIRVWSYVSPSKKFLSRMFHQASFCLFACLGAMLVRNVDIVFSYSPPLPLGLTAWIISSLRRAPWILQLEDIFPDAAVSTGILKNKTVISFFSSMERFLYKQASHISLISEGFKKNLTAKGVPPEKVTVIPPWADCDQVRPLSKENDFVLRNGLTGKFIVVYAGNLGVSSCPEIILDAAANLSKVESIVFLIIGEGIKKDTLIQQADENRLTNVVFLPYQPRSQFAEMLAAANLHLVLLNEESSGTSMPSKTFNIMAAARPILMVAPLSSDIARVVIEIGCGIAVAPGDPDLLAEEILHFMEYPGLGEEMGRNGRVQLEKRYSRRECIIKHEEMMLGIVNMNGVTA
jgi:putative colanic acid biosynthesis glycosyltransferase WcaI